LAQNFSMLFSYSRTFVRNDQGTSFDLHRFVFIDCVVAYTNFFDRCRDVRKSYFASFDYKNRFALKMQPLLKFPSYIMTVYDFKIRARF
jgi:hypothetical protein